jgi:hypothetical protein
MSNGKCDRQEDGCTEFVLLDARMAVVEKFIKELKDDQKWAKRKQTATLIGIALMLGGMFLQYVMG